MAEAFYRIVKTRPPTRHDFTSNYELGKRLANPTPQKERLHRGVSVWTTAARARAKARDYPALGGFVAELRVLESDAVTWERSLGRGHVTTFGEPAILLACVTGVEPVEDG